MLCLSSVACFVLILGGLVTLTKINKHIKKAFGNKEYITYLKCETRIYRDST